MTGMLDVQGFDPRTGSPAGEPVAATGLAEVDRIATAAAATLPVWSGLPSARRAEVLDSLADALEKLTDELVAMADKETALGSVRLHGEVGRTTGQLRMFADLLRRGLHVDAVISPAAAGRPDVRRMQHPIGPVAVFSASNFPFAFSVAGGDTASALAAGCPVVVKAHEAHPRTSVLVADVLRGALVEAGLPAEILGLVHGFEAGGALVRHPAVKAAGFTGSLRGGRALYDIACARPDPIPFYGELGSVNPAFVTPETAEQQADGVAAGFVGSVSLGNGQFCTKPGLLFVPAGAGIEDRVAAIAGERPAAPMLSEQIRSGYSEALRHLAERPGVRVIAGTTSSDGDPAPTVLATTVPELLADAEALTQECFGPAAIVVSYGSEDELLSAARVFDGQLTATIHGSGQEPVSAALRDVLSERVGRVVWNGWPTGVSVSYAQHHGGPYPATTSIQTTSVGTAAIDRFLRPVTFQDAPDEVLPPALQEDNPWRLPRRVDGVLQPPSGA
jgi:NADP-dependent aldehyde dehydrogenase